MGGAEGAPLPREGQGTELRRQGPPRPGPTRERRWVGHQRENLRRRLACVKGGRAPLGPQVGPKGPKPAQGAGGIFGAGPGQLSPRRRGVPGRIETQRRPIVFEGGRGGSCRGKVLAAARGYPRRRRENPPGRSRQRPLGFSIRVGAGQTPGGAGSGTKPPVASPGRVIPLPRGREAGRRPPGDSAAYEARTITAEPRPAGRDRRPGRRPPAGRGRGACLRGRPPTSGQEGTSFCP